MFEIVRLIEKIAMMVILYPFRLLPIRRNRVILFNNLGYKYSCNPKYVAEYLAKHYAGEFELIYPVTDTSKYQYLREKKITPVKINSIRYFHMAMTAKVFLTNSGGVSFLPMRRQQYVINTWHGGGAFKKVGVDMYNNSAMFRWDLKQRAKKTNVFLSTCRRFTDTHSVSLLTPKEIFWEIGMPRDDILIHGDDQIRQRVRKKLGLKDGQHLVLFAPTYRKIDDNYFKDSVVVSYGLDSERLCAALSERFGGTWKFAVRYHPCVTNRGDVQSAGIMDLTDYEDMQELLLAADVMINDFSSSMWDFMLTGRPGFLFAVDWDHYVKTTEVYTSFSDFPFEHAKSNDELIEKILNFNETAFASARKTIYRKMGGCESGKATALVCRRIAKVCGVRKEEKA